MASPGPPSCGADRPCAARRRALRPDLGAAAPTPGPGRRRLARPGRGLLHRRPDRQCRAGHLGDAHGPLWAGAVGARGVDPEAAGDRPGRGAARPERRLPAAWGPGRGRIRHALEQLHARGFSPGRLRTRARRARDTARAPAGAGPQPRVPVARGAALRTAAAQLSVDWAGPVGRARRLRRAQRTRHPARGDHPRRFGAGLRPRLLRPRRLGLGPAHRRPSVRGGAQDDCRRPLFSAAASLCRDRRLFGGSPGRGHGARGRAGSSRLARDGGLRHGGADPAAARPVPPTPSAHARRGRPRDAHSGLALQRKHPPHPAVRALAGRSRDR